MLQMSMFVIFGTKGSSGLSGSSTVVEELMLSIACRARAILRARAMMSTLRMGVL